MTLAVPGFELRALYSNHIPIFLFVLVIFGMGSPSYTRLAWNLLLTPPL
jgi:hypothetical protein